MSGEAAMRADRLADLLERLRELDNVSRASSLEDLRRDDPSIAADLEMLLAAAPASIEDQIRVLATSLDGDAEERIGPYRVLGVIGEGGFGIVHIAEQVEPVHRIVALKVIKPGMDTREVLTRFRHEVQALGAMDHPSIPAVLDAGETPDHRPFVVMPLIPGSSITQYCLEQKLDVNGRVRLLLEACRAIQHAHSRGVIHRDLKPDNILVSRSDGAARPAIIDFGLAKALAPLFDGRTAVTLSGQVVGTPEYMAPEQAEGPGDVDVRADVYSLGAILFELLAGRPPFTAAELRAAGHTGMRRILAEQDPPPPSHFATLPRELDWICARCLEKSPERRYPTADALASDLERFREGREVVAGPVGGA
jgi:serine/threonine protein kinase